MVVRIELNQDECIGCGACVAVGAEFFEMDGDKAKVKVKEAKDAASVQEAADNCPVGCIKIIKLK